MIDFHVHSLFSDGDQSIDEIVSSARRRNLSAVAITDHIDNEGRFLYLRDVSLPRPFKEYVDAIREAKRRLQYPIYAGVEISAFTTNDDFILPDFSDLDFLLIETYQVQKPNIKSFDPIEKALMCKDKLGIPVGFAHPDLAFIERCIDECEKNDLFLELNTDKLIRGDEFQEKILIRLKELLSTHPHVKLSVGSDAHVIFMIGSVQVAWKFLIENDFLSRLIFRP
ncbi:MAG: PHP domain-containing protein [Candidatus Helarchaeota archaeon]